MNTPGKIVEDEWIETSRGADAINFQRNAHMTWISVLMAMVVVVLAEKMSAILGQAWTQGRWYLLLYVISSGLIIVQSWVQINWLTLISRSPIQAVRTGLSLLNGIAIYFICASVENPADWFRAVGFFLIVSILQLITALRQRLIEGSLAKSLYNLVAAIGVCVGIVFLASWHLTVDTRAPVIWLWGVIATGLMTSYLWLQSRGMAEGRRDRDIP